MHVVKALQYWSAFFVFVVIQPRNIKDELIENPEFIRILTLGTRVAIYCCLDAKLSENRMRMTMHSIPKINNNFVLQGWQWRRRPQRR